MQQTRVCLTNFAKALTSGLCGMRVYTIDYTACKSHYEHKDEPRQMPLVYTDVGKINQVGRLCSIVLAEIRKVLRHRFII